MTNEIDIAAIIAEEVRSFETTATEFAKTRFLALSAEFNGNDKEAAEIEKIADRVQCIITNNENSFDLEIKFNESSNNYFEIISEGMPAPVSGGDDGIAHNPDGSTYHSKVPEQLCGTVLDEYAETGIDIVGEIKMMLKDLFYDRIMEAINNAKREIAEAYKQIIFTELNLR